MPGDTNPKEKDLGVSRFALSVARFLDRLPEGEFEFRLLNRAGKPRLISILRSDLIRNIEEKIGEQEPNAAQA